MTIWYLNMIYLPERELQTATGGRMFLVFIYKLWFCSLPQRGKALVDDCELTLQTQWRENAPKKDKFNFRLPSVAQKRLCVFGTPTWRAADGNRKLYRKSRDCKPRIEPAAGMTQLTKNVICNLISISRKSF